MAENARDFGDFEILRRLGVGGMAETFVAKRRTGGIEQRVCLKRILPSLSQDDSFTQQFLREARLAAVLRHSNVVGILSFGEVAGNYFMALELVDGLDLRDLLRSTPGRRLSADLVAFLALELAYALAYAHGVREGEIEGVVHRDISPANVLLSVHGEVKLADFGIAKAMRNHAATASGLVKGKIPYMAPEQMRAEAVDGRADLFSLGVTLYEALAGRRPFRGEHDVETMRLLLAGDRPSLAELAPDAPPALVQAIEGLIAIERDERTRSADELIEALAQVPPSPRAKPELAACVREASAGAHDVDALAKMDTELAPAPTQALPGVEATPSAAAVEVAAADAATRTSLARAQTPTEPISPGAELDAEAKPRGWAPAIPTRSEAAPRRQRPWILPTLVAVAALGAIAFAVSPGGVAAPAEPVTAATAASTAEVVEPPMPAEPTHAVEEPAPATPPDAAFEDAPTPASRRGSSRADPRPPAPTPAPTPEPNPAPVGGVAVQAEAAPDAGAPVAPTGPGRLQVMVIPWGEVWVDGDYMGRAPVTVSVEPGSHRVAAGVDAPTVTRRVRVRAGQTRRVELELEE